jgi:hypothetical protein
VSGAGPIWHQFMRTVLRDQPELSFERPDGLVEVEICTLSGLLPSPDCPYTRREWFIEGTQPTEVDTLYQRVVIDTATGFPADETTPAERRESHLYLDLPAQAQQWAQRQGLPLLPEVFASQGAKTESEALIIASPDAYTIYRISPELPLDAQRLRIVIVALPGLRDVTIYLDGVPFTQIAAAPFEVWWVLEEGDHVLYATGITADGWEAKSDDRPFRVNPPTH